MNQKPQYSSNQIYDLCLQICKDEDSKTMSELLEVVSEDQYLYDPLDWMHIGNILSNANFQLCCA